MLFAAELTYGIQVDGRAVAEPVRAELYFPAGGTPVGETVTVAFYPVEGDPLMLAATVTGDCAGESAGALVTVMFDGEGFTLNDQAVASVDGRYEVIVRTEEPQTEEPQAEEPDEESLLAEELAQLKAELEQARAGLDGTAVLEEEALADAADGTVYATEASAATFTVVSIGCGDAWTYSSTATGVTVEGAPSGVDIESQIVTGSSGFPVGSLGSGDRAVAGVLVTLTTPLGDTLVGVPVDGMSARIPVGTDAYDGQEVEVALYGDDGCTYTYTPVVHDGMVYLAIPAGGYIEVIARADLLKAAVPEDGEDPAKPGDATTSDDDVRERLAQTGDGSAAAIVAAGLAGAAALAAGAIVLRRSRRS